jgi:hypothetical protein
MVGDANFLASSVFWRGFFGIKIKIPSLSLLSNHCKSYHKVTTKIRSGRKAPLLSINSLKKMDLVSC